MSTRRAISRPHGYGVVLALVVASALFQIAAPDTDWARLTSIGLGAATLVTAVRAAEAHHAVVRAAAGTTVVLAVAAVAVLIVTGELTQAPSAIVNCLLIAFAPTVIGAGLVRDIRREGTVTVRTLSGVLAIYLLMGMAFSLVGIAVAAIDGGEYFAGITDATRSDFLYFSYVTLSTTGFGDLSPITDLGRMLAVTEALIGQVYLVTIVALIVANLRPRAVGR
jgi:hypothetical protein